jgi:hypothetical protein
MLAGRIGEQHRQLRGAPPLHEIVGAGLLNLLRKEIELETGVPLKAKTVGDVRALSTWPPGLRLVYDREHGFMRVRIERV